MIVGAKVIAIIIKTIAKQFKLDKILKYVEKPNELDKAMKQSFSVIQGLTKRITALEDISHPKRDFVVCDECKGEVEEKNEFEKKWYDK